MEMAPADASARGASSAPDDMSSKRPAPASPPVAALNASPPNSPPAKSAKGLDAASPEPARSLAGAFAAASRAPLPDPSCLPRLRVCVPPGLPSAPSSGATADHAPAGMPEGPPSLFSRLECLDAEEDDADLLAATYPGPNYDELDETVQEEFHRYLEARGVDHVLANYVAELHVHKEQTLYVDWISKVQGFVGAKE